MPITQTSSVSYDQAAWEKMAYFALRPELIHDGLASVKATNQSMEGASVSFVLQADMAANTTPLVETTSATPTTLSDSTVTVSLVEYGDLAQSTAKLRGTSFVPFDPIVANVVGYGAGVSLDTLARDVLVAGTNVAYGGAATSRVTVAAGHIYTAAAGARAVAQLKGADAPTIGGKYIGIIHPDTEYDFQGEVGGRGWRDAQTYTDSTKLLSGETGTFGMIRYLVNSRGAVLANAGVTSTVEVYQTLILGGQALAKAHSKSDGNGALPRVRPAPVTDPHWRFTGIGWYWLGGYGIFRQNCLRRVEHSSSLAVNV